MTDHTDVVIVGAGPVGLFAIFELGLLNIKCHVIDNLDKPGGQCAELYPEKPIFDIPSRTNITGQELTDDLMRQAKPFHPVFHLNQQVEKVEKINNSEWVISTNQGKVIQAKCIVIAAGAGSFVPRKPPLEGIENFEGKNVFYSVKDKSIFKNKTVLIAGGGDSALDWTNELSKIAKVNLIHRRKEFRAAPDSVSKMLELEKNDILSFFTGQLTEISTGSKKSLKVQYQDNDNLHYIEVDYLLPFYGLKMELGPIVNWDLNLHENHINVDTEKFETSLILSGFHEAALMAQGCFKYCFPDKKNVFRYTTVSKDLHKKLGVK